MEKMDIANKYVVNALHDLEEVVNNLQAAEENLTYKSFTADLVAECQRILYTVKHKLQVVSNITEKVF
jgi:exonuclease VII small subunit